MYHLSAPGSLKKGEQMPSESVYTNGVLFSGSLPGIFAEETCRSQNFSMTTRHTHENLELYFLFSGDRFYFVDQDTYHLKKQMAILVNRNQIHKTSPAGPGEAHRFLIQLDPVKLQPFFRELGFRDASAFGDRYWGAVSFSDSEWALADALLARIRKCFREPDALSSAEIRLSCLEIFLLFARCRTAGNRIKAGGEENKAIVNTGMYQKVHEIALYLQNHSAEPLSLSALSGRFYLSRSYLTRIFKSVTGFTVLEYQTYIRMQKAQLLLKETDLSITEIAAETGFGNVTYFERIFRKATSVTPFRYRRDRK